MQNFSIFKANKDDPNDKRPDYRMSIKDGDKFVEIGGCWLKESKTGSKYFSCKLSAPYKDRKGYELKEVLNDNNAETSNMSEDTPF